MVQEWGPFHEGDGKPGPIPPSIRVFSNESTLRMRWPKYWSFSFSIIPSQEIPGPISFKWTGWISLQSKGLSRVFSNTTAQKHQFFSAQLSSQSNSAAAKSLQSCMTLCDPIDGSPPGSVLPMNIQKRFPLRWTAWISLQSRGFSRVFSNTTAQKHQFFSAQLSLWPDSHIHT